MPALSIRALALVVASCSVALAACSSSSDLTNPTQPPAGAQVIRLNVSGPGEIAPGATAQFKATAHYSDGSLRDVTSDVAWSSSDDSILSFSNGGIASGIRNGQTSVVAAVSQVTGSSLVMVVPEGTFKLTVAVFGADSPTQAVSGAAVELLTADGTLLSPVVESSTLSAFYGIRGRVEVHTNLPLFYEANITTVDVAAHQTLKIYLKRLDRPGLVVTGAYTLTITASPSCGSLPSQALTRTYSANVTQQVAERFVVTLDDAVFEAYEGVLGNSIEGRVLDAGRAQFDLLGRGGVDWGAQTLLLETLADPEGTFEPTGSVIATIDDTGMSGSFDGHLGFSQKQPLQFFTCYAKDHVFTLARR